jgi:hypothetical protein
MQTFHQRHFFRNFLSGRGLAFLAVTFAMHTAWGATASKAPAATKSSAQDKIAQETFKQTKDQLNITIDEKTAVDALPALEAEGVIPKIAPADIVRAPLGMSVAVVGVSFSVVILDSVYAGNAATDKLIVQAFVLPIGSKQKQLCYTFDYSRDMYKKMDFNKLTPKDFMLNTPGFTFTDWCRTNMQKEGKGKK